PRGALRRALGARFSRAKNGALLTGGAEPRGHGGVPRDGGGAARQDGRPGARGGGSRPLLACGLLRRDGGVLRVGPRRVREAAVADRRPRPAPRGTRGGEAGGGRPGRRGGAGGGR